MFALVIGAAFTGTVLKWDQEGFEALGHNLDRTVKGILAAGTETTDQPAASVPSAPAHLHGPTRLFAIDTNSEVAS